MTYRDSLYPWCIIRLLPDLQRMLVQRFRRRGDAEAYLKMLQSLLPDTPHIIIFDPSDQS